MDILLVAPRLGPENSRYYGDHAYVDTLLAYPPDGVQYLHYEDLIDRGLGWQQDSFNDMTYYLKRAGILPPDIWFESFKTKLAPDLIHLYGFSARIRFGGQSSPIPLVAGAGTGSYSD